MNNAIEHSGGDKIIFSLQKDPLYTEISIVDNGVGIFRNIQKYADEKYGLALDRRQAALELYKGRLTTDPSRHSGEGIFFVSKMLTEFAIWSENIVYSYRCGDRDRFVQSHLISYYTKMEGMGTMAVMKLENEAVRTSAEVFDEFAPLEEGFVKTLIPMRDMCPLGNPVARSQARRILRRLEEFWEIIFDFCEIGFMGQGFADEVFRVFQNMHPEIKLTVVNANAAVEGIFLIDQNTVLRRSYLRQGGIRVLRITYPVTEYFFCIQSPIVPSRQGSDPWIAPAVSGNIPPWAAPPERLCG